MLPKEYDLDTTRLVAAVRAVCADPAAQSLAGYRELCEAVAPFTGFMAVLPRHLELMVLDAVRNAGSYEPHEVLPYIEENLNMGEIELLRGFLGWVHKNGLAFGHGNIQVRYSEYIRGCKNHDHG